MKCYVTALLGLTLVGCADPRQASPEVSPQSSAATQPAALDDVADRYFEDLLALNPTAASFIGDHRFDDRITNSLSPEYLESTRALEQRTLDALREFDEATLSEQDRLTHAVMAANSRVILDGLAYPAHLLPFDQLNNDAVFFAQMGSGTSVHPFASVKDYENFLSRIDAFTTWTDQAISNMREGAGRGIVQPRILMEKTLPIFAALIVAEPGQSVFWQPVANMPAAFSAADRARLTAAYRDAIAGKVIPAYRRLHDFVRDEYLPKCRETVGWSALPGGREWYAYLARANTTTELTPDELHQLGLDEVARIRGEIAGLMGKTGFRGTFTEFLRLLRTDQRFYYRTPEEIVTAHRERLPKVLDAVPRIFSLMPKAPIEVRRFEPFREATQAAAEYYPPSADGTRPAVFYVNGYDATSRPNFDADALFLHEAIPGHHFQIALTQESTALPRVRRFAGGLSLADQTTAYVEGWGLYAETLGEELGLYTDPYQKIGALFYENWRAARLVIDTGVHTRGWTREQALDYMRQNIAAGETDIVAEVERYIAWPGQALAYKVGQLTITRLRRQAEQRLGTRFDVREFHAQILNDGPLPLGVLEAKVNRWIEATP
jgi:uncharacterized protein (DUF885 family)